MLVSYFFLIFNSSQTPTPHSLCSFAIFKTTISHHNNPYKRKLSGFFMEKLEEVFEDSDIDGICPGTGRRANMEYRGRVMIRNPKKEHSISVSMLRL